MRQRVALFALIALVASPVAAVAQQPPPSGMELRQPRPPTVVHPPVTQGMEQAAQDAEQAKSEIEAKTQRYQILREGATAPSSRPDLGYDVRSGIQSQRINNAIKK
jgi:hypothetical protein